MAHAISVIVTKQTIKEAAAAEIDLVSITKGEFSLVPLDACHSDYWAEKLNLDYQSFSEMIHDSSTTLEFAKRLEIDEFAILETEYFGGIGSQAAAVYYKGKRILLQKDKEQTTSHGTGAINQALSKIGVVAGDKIDEFEAIGLHEHRSFGHLFEKYDEY